MPSSTRPGPTNRNNSRVSHTELPSHFLLRRGRHATRALLDWFATEQVEERAVSSNIHARLKLINGDPAGLLDLDRELGARAYVVPPPLAGKL